MIILSSAMSGIYLIKIARERICVCEELLVFCDMLKNDISTRRTELDTLISSIADNPCLSHISFINSDFICGKKELPSSCRLSAVMIYLLNLMKLNFFLRLFALEKQSMNILSKQNQDFILLFAFRLDV